MLSSDEIKRYDRHLLLSEIGIEGQEKLKRAKVLVVGAGGLGCPVLQYLTAAGVGNIGVVDFDRVDESNLQRQVLYTIDDVGFPKADCAVKKLSRQNPFVTFTIYNEQLNSHNAIDIISDYDIVVDGTDNFPSRYLVNDVCVLLDKVLVYASISKFEGQLSVFNYTNEKGEKGPTYRCLFPEPPSAGEVPNCSEAGVMGVLPGILGTLQANETIKLIVGAGEVLSGKLFVINALTMQSYTVSFNRVQEYDFTEASLINTDYDFFCNGGKSEREFEVSCDQLYKWINSEREKIQLIDVREEYEQPEVDELSELSIPLNEILERFHQIDRIKKVVLYCRTGSRSLEALELLKSQKGLSNVYSLKGGIMEWLND